MVRAMKVRTATYSDFPAVLNLVEITYGRRLTENLIPKDNIVVEQDGVILGFASLYRMEGVALGSVDWVAIEENRGNADRIAILEGLIDGIRNMKKKYGLRIIMIHTPYEEIRTHLDSPDLQPGEQNIRRLSVFRKPNKVT